MQSKKMDSTECKIEREPINIPFQSAHHSMFREKIGYTPKEASFLCGTTPGTLANMRSRKVGPRYHKLGKKIIYLRKDLEAWVRQEPINTLDSIREG